MLYEHIMLCHSNLMKKTLYVPGGGSSWAHQKQRNDTMAPTIDPIIRPTTAPAGPPSDPITAPICPPITAP